jgi:FkbM family methyltransferase
LPQGAAVSEMVFRNGLRVVHPPNRGGLIGTVLEMWHHNVYQIGEFYQPKPGDVVVDAGAHVGLFSLWLLQHEPTCRIVAFEPSPENYACLKQNLSAAMPASNFTLYQKAVGGEHGKVRMMEITTNRSFDARVTKAEEDDATAVDVVTLADIFDMAKTQRIALLKMDAEGGEHGAFKTADESLFSRIDHIAMEYHDNIIPGTVEMISKRLSKTHDVTVLPDPGELHGRLFATIKK